ncbi:hypothetical protein M8J76_002203 [Diaphorina citri]|nr:hypothetical protein M8J76_002203 [Diaphorina citri]
MSSVKKLVRDSLDDEDVSDDVDDEVFIRDGRTFKLDDDRGLKRPLMAPRRKFKSSSSYFSYGESSTLKKLRVPFCYTLLCVIILCCLIALALILINMNTTYMLNKLMHPSSDSGSNSDNSYKPCTDYEVEELWHYTLPKIKSETPVRSVDINGDGIEDVIIGYGTGADQADLPSYTCEMYFGQSGPCAGGVLALDGKTGALLWQEWLKRSVLKLDCSYDVTQDDVNDCLVSGESGLLCIINGKIGRVTWCLPHNELAWSTGGLGLDFYAGEFIPDVNEDGVVDVISTHTNGSSATMIGSHVIILSGATGEVLHHLTSPVPGEMMLSSPHILVRPDGESVVVFCTVRNNAPTSIYVVSLSSLVNGDSNLVKSIYSDIEGLTASPILIDMNDDQTEDIVVNSKSKLLVFNGLNYSLILNISYPFDDSYEHDIPFLPVPGYFNNDTIPDFFVTYSVGSTEFLYYSVSTVLDGKTGKSLLSAPIIRSNIADVSGITLSSPGYGNDAFVYWMSSCRSYEVDICNARFNTSTEIKLMLLSQHVPSPGIVLYSSSTNFETEINGTANILEQVKEYINLHPEVKEKIEEYQVNRLGSSPAKCNNAELEALQPPVYYMPNAYDPEMIPDPVPRAYPRDRYPGDNLNPPEYQNIGPDFPAPDEETRERDERDDETNTSEDIAKVNENTDSSGSDHDVLDKTSDMAKVDKESGSKEEMPREKRSSNKIMPRRKRKIAGNVYEYTDKYENEGDDKFFGNDMEEETSRTYGNENIHDQTQITEKNNNFSAREESFYENPKELYGKLDKEDQMENEKYSLKENHKNLHERGYEMNGSMGEVDDNHAGEVFDEYADEMEYRKQIANRENNDVDENHGGESLDDYDEDEPKLEMKIRHAQKYKNVERDEPKRRENKLVGNEIDRDYANDEAYKDQKDLDTNRRTEENKRSRQKGYDYKEDEDSDDEDEDDNEEEEENEEENLKETEQDDIEEDDEDNDVEQLWDDFIEINVLNHRGYNDDYEFDAIVKDDSKNKRTEIQNSIDSKNNIKYPEHSKQMVSYNLHATNKDNHHPINGLHEKLTSANHNSKPDNIVSHIVDENDLQQKFNHFSTLDQLKLINRINKNNKTKQNRIIKNNLDIAGSSGNNDQTMGSAKKLTENMTNDIKNFKVILKNGENFKYNDYYKWKDNSEYVNFDSYYNILKNTDGGDSNDMEGNNYESNKNRIIPNNITTKQTVEVPSKLFSLQKNLTIHCNSYFFKRRLECEDNSKSNTQTVSEDTKNKHSSKKQKSSRKIRKKLHEKTQTNLGIKHIVVNDTKSDTKGRALVIEKMNYKFPYNFGKEKIYSEKDLELIFNNETHAEIKKIMKLNLKKINDSISKIKNGSRNSSANHHHWSNVNYYKSHKLIRNKSDNNIDDKDYKPDNNHTNEFMKQTNKTAKDIWFNTLHSLKNNKQFLKHLKSTTYKSNRVIGNSRNSDEESNHFNSDVDLSSNNLLNEQNADLITKKIDLQNNIERIQISELKNSKNKTNKLFPYRRRDKNVQDKTNNENRIENLFGLTDNMITIVNHTRNVRPNKTENTVLGLPVGGKYSSHLNWHEKNQYGLPLRNKWESTTEILANSQRHHRLLKVKKRSIEDVNQPVKRGLIETREDEGIIKNVDESKSINVGITSKDNSYLTNISKYQKRSTAKKDLSETIIASPKNNSNPLRKSPGGAKHAQTSNEVTSDIKETNENMTLNNTFNQDKLDSSNVGNKDFYSQKDRMSTSDNIVKRSIEKYLKILPRASSTPILLNSISNDTNSLDIVFVSFWVPPKVDIKKLTKSQQDCVRLKVLRAKSINCYSAFDDLVIEEEMAKQCINLDENASQEDVRGENIQYNQYYLQGDTQSPFYNPFNLRFGQLSVYRVRIKCKQCSSVFETIQNQGWPSGNGQMSNGVFVKKHAHRG